MVREVQEVILEQVQVEVQVEVQVVVLTDPAIYLTEVIYGGDGDASAVAVEVPEELVDDRTAFDPSKLDIQLALIKRLNYNPKYSRIRGIGSRVMGDQLDLVELKILHAMLNFASQK